MYSSDFFFSSRRRHTRWPRDWSSDVCSSDLGDEDAGHRQGQRGAVLQIPADEAEEDDREGRIETEQIGVDDIAQPLTDHGAAGPHEGDRSAHEQEGVPSGTVVASGA